VRAQLKERRAFRILHDFAADARHQFGVRHFGACVADDAHVGWQQAHLVESEQSGIRLAFARSPDTPITTMVTA
jgi:hypothetical protein